METTPQQLEQRSSTLQGIFIYIPSFNHLSSLTLIRPLIPRSFSSYSTSSNHLSFSHPLTIIRSPKVIPCSFAFLCVSVAPIYNTLIWRLRVTVLRKDVEKWGEGNLILEPKNRMLIRIKLVSLSWPAMQLNKLLKINLKQSGSILLLPLSLTMRLHQPLFQVEGCGPIHNESPFPKQSISRQLIHLPVKNSSVISSVD